MYLWWRWGDLHPRLTNLYATSQRPQQYLFSEIENQSLLTLDHEHHDGLLNQHDACVGISRIQL